MYTVYASREDYIYCQVSGSYEYGLVTVIIYIRV
jgi:hypothetical protein